jgi:outer membrane protein insertion porin family
MYFRKKTACAVLSAMFLFGMPYISFAQEADETTSAEESTDWYYGKNIRDVRFKGLVTTKKNELDGTISSFIGQPFSDELFASLYDRVYSLDLFDSIIPNAVAGDERKNTVVVEFTVVEKPKISTIRFVGNKQVRSSELKTAISLKTKEIFVTSKMLVDERSLRDFYLKKGYTNVSVSASYEEKDDGIEVTFKIDEGHTTVISNITFEGNTVVTDKTLKKQLSLKEVRKIGSKGEFQEASLDKDRQAIRSYYTDRGYADMQIRDVVRTIEYNPDKKRDEMTIHYVIQEGSPYTFEGITFNGNTIFTDEELSKGFKIKEGEVFNQSKFQQGMMDVVNMYYNNGYTSNGFNPIPAKDSEKKTLSYTIIIQENPRSHIENVVIKGNNRTKDHVIRREIMLESGDVFTANKLQTSLRNLYNLQYFSSVVPDVQTGSEPDLVDLIFTVEEQSTTSIEFGVTFSGVTDSDDLPVSLFVKWTDSNVGGLGKTLSASSTLSTTEKTVGLEYSENWWLGLPINMSLSASYSYSDLVTYRNYTDPTGAAYRSSYYMDYQQQTASAGLGLAHRWTPDFAILTLSGGISGSLINNMYDSAVYVPIDATIEDYHNNWTPLNSVWTSFSVDDRDINYDPSKGWFVSQGLRWYGLIPAIENQFFLRTDTKLEGYLTLWNWQVSESWAFKGVLMGYSGVSMLFPTADTTLGRRNKLYIDGMFNGRGWSVSSNRGKALWSNILELRIPLVPHIIALDGFFDAVAIASEPEDLGRLTLQDFYYSTGPGIRFTIPQFPLRLLWANTFQLDENNDVNWKNNWKFVLSFNMVNK